MSGVEGYANGPAAATEATRLALARVLDPVAMILVEGISDQIAIDALATRRERDLLAERVAVVPIGGAQAVRRFVAEHPGTALVALCDVAEQPWFLRVLSDAQVFTCHADLEDELVRAVGPDRVEAVLAAHGDLDSFRTMQKQPAWAGRPVTAQIRRWLGSGARRKSRYARLLTEAAVELDHVPAPLEGVLNASCCGAAGCGAPAPDPPGGR